MLIRHSVPPSNKNRERRPAGQLAVISFSVFVNYLTAGLVLPVIPLFVQQQLGLNNVMVGLAVGGQFLATLATRGLAGRIADRQGGRRAVMQGIFSFILVAIVPMPVRGQFVLLLAGRLLLGFGESLLLTGNLAWGMGLMGPKHSARVISWNGMALYGALALGAPLGLWLYAKGGFITLSLVCLLLPPLTLLFNKRVPAVAPQGGERLPFWQVTGEVTRPGIVLALQGTGFAVVGTFTSLYFSAKDWGNAGFALTAFGVAFVMIRLLFGSLPDKAGGYRVTLISLLTETAGLAILGFASSGWMALIGAGLTGCGCSLVFPALGSVVVKSVSPQMRATALGVFSAFQDLAYGVSGPLTGLLISRHGYSSAYLACALCTALGAILTSSLFHKALTNNRTPQPGSDYEG